MPTTVITRSYSIRLVRILSCVLGFFLGLNSAIPLFPQSQSADKIIQQMEKEGCASLESGAKVCRYDFAVQGKAVEAISFVPPGDGPFPGVLMIPGYQRTARDLLPLGARFAREGLAAVAVTQPGFGKSQGPPDFVGPKTIAVLKVAYRKLQQERYV